MEKVRGGSNKTPKRSDEQKRDRGENGELWWTTQRSYLPAVNGTYFNIPSYPCSFINIDVLKTDLALFPFCLVMKLELILLIGWPVCIWVSLHCSFHEMQFVMKMDNFPRNIANNYTTRSSDHLPLQTAGGGGCQPTHTRRQTSPPAARLHRTDKYITSGPFHIAGVFITWPRVCNCSNRRLRRHDTQRQHSKYGHNWKGLWNYNYNELLPVPTNNVVYIDRKDFHCYSCRWASISFLHPFHVKSNVVWMMFSGTLLRLAPSPPFAVSRNASQISLICLTICLSIRPQTICMRSHPHARFRLHQRWDAEITQERLSAPPHL